MLEDVCKVSEKYCMLSRKLLLARTEPDHCQGGNDESASNLLSRSLAEPWYRK